MIGAGVTWGGMGCWLCRGDVCLTCIWRVGGQLVRALFRSMVCGSRWLWSLYGRKFCQPSASASPLRCVGVVSLRFSVPFCVGQTAKNFMSVTAQCCWCCRMCCRRPQIKATPQLFAFGVANLAGSIFSALPGSASLSRGERFQNKNVGKFSNNHPVTFGDVKQSASLYEGRGHALCGFSSSLPRP